MDPFWRDRAACAGEDTDLFFDDRATNLAKFICIQCPVMEQCLRFAFDEEILYGVYGGMTATERRTHLRKARKSTRKTT